MQSAARGRYRHRCRRAGQCGPPRRGGDALMDTDISNFPHGVRGYERDTLMSLWYTPLVLSLALTAATDERNIRLGREIPTLSYADQPYIVQTDDGAWLCAVTTGTGHEGAPGQNVATQRSADQGRTWSEPVFVEPLGGPETSYAVMLKVPSGRIYIFYNHNTDNIREIPMDRGPGLPPGVCRRVDSLGYYVFKYSDDGGRSWSEQRYPVPVREMEIDRLNPFQGRVRYFWNVGKPLIHEGVAYLSLHKVGGIGEGFFTSSEGVLLRCEEIVTELDPAQFRWETLPQGDAGLRTPPGGGTIAEEQSYVVLSDGTFYSIYRTIDGHPACAYSRDRGRHWTTPRYETFADGRPMKHPRAANFVWKCENGKYLYWFHNHGGRFIGEHPRVRSIAYDDRNPVWLCGGVEVDGPDGQEIRWSQPEIVLYDDDPYVRISYPDLIEEGGEYFLTETQKEVARLHPLDSTLLESLWSQLSDPQPAEDGILLALPPTDAAMPGSCTLPALPAFTARDTTRLDYGSRDLRQGFSLDLWLRLDSLEAGQVILDNRDDEGRGFCLQTTPRQTLELILHDGRSESRWDCDPGWLEAGKRHHVAAIVDGGPKVIMFVVDGRLCDGGGARQFGWGRFNPHYRGPSGNSTLLVGSSLRGEVLSLRIYGRALRTSEAIGNFVRHQAEGASAQ